MTWVFMFSILCVANAMIGIALLLERDWSGVVNLAIALVMLGLAKGAERNP